jgi:hypothetical protein
MQIPIHLSPDIARELWSGTIGAFLGAIIGAVAAYCGAARLQSSAEKTKHRGAARALLVEMRFNAGDLCAGLNEPRVSDAVWHEQLPSIVAQLALKEFEPVLVSYWELSHLPARTEERTINVRRKRLEAAALLLEAIKTLSSPKILSRGEQKHLEKELDDMRSLLKANKNSLDYEEKMKSNG